MAATQSKYPHLTLFCVQQVNVGCGLLLEEGSPGAERGSENEREWKITAAVAIHEMTFLPCGLRQLVDCGSAAVGVELP